MLFLPSSSCLAALFSWVTGTVITKEEAMRCAKREPGRSWEAIDSELAALGALRDPYLLRHTPDFFLQLAQADVLIRRPASGDMATAPQQGEHGIRARADVARPEPLEAAPTEADLSKAPLRNGFGRGQFHSCI